MAAVLALWGESRRFRLGEQDREILLRVGPLLDHAPARRAKQDPAVAMAVFVAVLGMDGRSCGEGERLARHLEADVADRLEMHLDPAEIVVPDRAVAKGVDRHVTVQLGVYPVK